MTSHRAGGSERVWIQGPAGVLEGLWLPGGSSVLDRGVVLCHPHPLHGGTMETKLVARTARRLSQSFQTLRFNFRGVGRSEGSWDGGEGESQDVGAALAYISAQRPKAVLAVFGFSFGAGVGLRVGRGDERVQALVGVAPPLGYLPADFLTDCRKPTLIVGAGADEIVDPNALADWVKARHEGCEFELIEGADHLFTGRTDVVADRVAEFLNRQFAENPDVS